MKNRKRILLASLLVTLLCGLTWFVLQSHEPEYQGRPLSYWLTGYDSKSYKRSHTNDPPPPTFGQADEAVRAIGADAIPALLKILRPESKLKTNVIALLQQQHVIKVSIEPPNPVVVFHAFRVLGPVTSNAVPELIRIFESNPPPLSQAIIPQLFGELGPAAALAVPTLLRGLCHSNEWVRINSAWALRHIHAEPGKVVPALIKCLSDSDRNVQGQAADALAAFGKDAQSAVPALLQMWQSESLKSQNAQTNKHLAGVASPANIPDLLF